MPPSLQDTFLAKRSQAFQDLPIQKPELSPNCSSNTTPTIALLTSPAKENTGVDPKLATNNDSVEMILLYDHCLKTPTLHTV